MWRAAGRAGSMLIMKSSSLAVEFASILGTVVLPSRIWFSIS
jgi:hypothetical protein